MACLQLFAPDFYRLGQREPAFLTRLEQWKEKDGWVLYGYLEQQPASEKETDTHNLRQLQRLEYGAARVVEADGISEGAVGIPTFHSRDSSLPQPAQPALPTLFVDRLLSSHPLAWRSALEQEERLAGKRLPCDPLLHRHTCFIDRAGRAQAAWRYPGLIHWENNFRTLCLDWPEDCDADRYLGTVDESP